MTEALVADGAGISVLILTRNEEHDLPGCLASVAWCDDVHVLDSESTDRTREIATAAGAHVAVRRFDNYAAQRNAGLALPFRHPWVFVLDADERTPPALAAEMAAFVRTATPAVAAGRVIRRDVWAGRWLRHAQLSPLFIRLLRVGKCHYEREVNEVVAVDGPIADLAQSLEHHPFSKGLAHWIAKHNVYSTMEADLIVNRRIVRPSLRAALFSRDFNQRRVHQKAIFYALPARPLVKFAYMMIWRRAFLDGMPGLRYALLQSFYEYLIQLKALERRGPP